MSFGSLVSSLLNDSLIFVQYAKQAERNGEFNIIDSYVRASILLSWSALEGWINYVAYSFAQTDPSLSKYEIAFLLEKKILINKNGLVEQTNQDEYKPTLTKLLFLLQRFGGDYDLKHSDNDVWRKLKVIESIRHSIVHPKSQEEELEVDIPLVEMSTQAIQEVIQIIKDKIYNK